MRVSRRGFVRALARSMAVLAASGLAGAGWAIFGEPNWPVVEHIQVPLTRLPARLDGLRIAQLSDLHISQYTTQDDLDRAVDLTMRQAADLIALTGDFLWQDAGLAGLLTRPLSRLAAPLGVFAIFGNHDHWHGAGQVADALRAASIPLLVNQAQRLPTGEDALWLAGVDDIWEQRQDLALTLREVPEGHCTILLAHEPDFADQVTAWRGQNGAIVDLQLSGHSHGGQVNLPLLGRPILPYLGRKYPVGLYRIANLTLYTNRGIGLVAPPIRFNCRPEITLLQLTRGVRR